MLWFTCVHAAAILSTCPMDPGYDYWGYDIAGGQPTNSSSECCSLCDVDPKCLFFSFETDTDPTYCHLKTSRAGREKNPHRISGARTGGPPAPPTPVPAIPTPPPAPVPHNKPGSHCCWQVALAAASINDTCPTLPHALSSHTMILGLSVSIAALIQWH